MSENKNDNIENKVNPAVPSTFAKYCDPLPIPAIAKPEGLCNCPGEEKALYNIAMKQVLHSFHKDFPPTRVWGYNGSYPGPTIEAYKDVPIQVKWINNLPDKHLLPVDHTLHGTMNTPDVRTVVHLHGANVEADSDGHPDAWFTRNYKDVGHTFTREIYEYTNHQQSATLWYHDHAVGITRLNVYAGLAGFYLIRDELEERLNLPSGDYEIPLLIQDRQFDDKGQLFYPKNSIPPPVPPPGEDPPVPSTPSFFFGNTIAVNGKLWPYLEVEPRKYRFRILNGSNVRAYGIRLSKGTFHQIGTDQGFLHKTVEIDTFILEPAERVDVIVDFSQFAGQDLILQNLAGDGGTVAPGDTNDMRAIMKFRVVLPLKCKDTSVIPRSLLPYHPVDPLLACKQRTMNLAATIDRYKRTLHLLNGMMWHDPPTEIVEKDSIEIWHLVNRFAFPHPIHVHLVDFEILGRKPFTKDSFDILTYSTVVFIDYFFSFP